MKSLEIVNKRTMFYGDVLLNPREAQQIKQDLEVLEILKKYIRVETYKPIDSKEWKKILKMYVYEEIPKDYFGVTEDLCEFTEEEMRKIHEYLL